MSPEEKDAFETRQISDAVSSFENEDNVEFLSKAQRAVFFLPANSPSRFDLLSAMGDVYANQLNAEMLEQVLTQMNDYPVAQDQERAQIAKELESKLNSILTSEKNLVGYWISDFHTAKKKSKDFNIPYLMLEINPNSYGLVARILYESKFMWETRSHLPISTSFQFDMHRAAFKFDYDYQMIKQGNVVLANQLLSSSQESRAYVQSAVRTAPTIGDAALATTGSVLMSSLMIGLANNAANSSVTNFTMCLSGSISSNDCLALNLNYKRREINTSDNIPLTTDYLSKDLKMLRWKESDNIIFSNEKAGPISPFVNKLTPGMALYKINHDYSMWNAKYLIPTLLCFVGGALLTINAIKQGDEGGPVWIYAGGFGAWFISLGRRNARKNAIRKYNQRMYDKLEAYYGNE